MANETMQEQLQRVCDEAQEKAAMPVLDGKYRLPDRRILIKKGDCLTIIGHRDKRKLKDFQKYTDKDLRNLLVYPCFGGYDSKTLERMDREELLRVIYPRPKQFFSTKWLTSESPSALRLAELVSKAVAI